ncbi:hypothetical protein [Mesorhizobium ciceri]|uniref:hypothetical protein n=1 Tax=Mesorhizobium TaxID=68287 RepID=UPI00047E650F|nr:hypothetical protein [Mesorhizobium ciceri]
MVSERSAAKKAIKTESQDDPELADAISTAHDYQLKLTQENNRHVEALRKQDLGFFGRAFGGEKSAPTYIASIAALIGLFGAGYCLTMAASIHDAAFVDFWSKQTERLVAFAVASLTFIFGRGSK